MSDETSFSVEEQRQQEDRHIERDLNLISELRAVLAEFHRRAAAEPGLWMDTQAAAEALGAAQEIRAIEHELGIFYLSQVRRAEAFRRALREGKLDSIPAGAEPVPPERVHFAQALSHREGFDHEVEHLRALGTAPDLVRRAERERRARLRWLLTLLAGVQPEAAHTIEDEWNLLRSRPPDEPGLCIERWERQTGDWLARFLEPLLPE